MRVDRLKSVRDAPCARHGHRGRCSQGSKTYRLDLACVGSGSARLVFKPASTGATTTVPCDQSVVQQRIITQEPIRVDAEGAEGATGVIAWQIGLL